MQIRLILAKLRYRFRGEKILRITLNPHYEKQGAVVIQRTEVKAVIEERPGQGPAREDILWTIHHRCEDIRILQQFGLGPE